MTRLLLTLLLCLAPALAWAHGSTFPSTDTTVIAVIDSNGNVVNVGDLTNQAIRTTVVGSGGTSVGGCTPTASAPSYAEGVDDNISCDLSGNTRMTFGTLLSGEDQTNNLLMTSGGKVRTISVATGMVVGGDATMTTAVEVPTGAKTFEGSVSGTGAITQTQTIYGGFVSPITTTNGSIICTLTLSGTTAKYDWCPVVTAAFPYYGVLTSGTTGTSATGAVKVGY
jgi:hypothetical protein